MKFLVAMSIAAFAAAASAAPPPADQAAVSQFACDLGGDCGGASSTAAPAAAEQAPHGAPRAAEVRGFTFKRTAPTPAAGTAIAPPPATATARASAPVATPAPAQRAANLQLDFASGSAELDAGDRQRLTALSAALESPRLAGRRLRIEGHTDAKGSAAKNRDLSQRRAQSVADFLVSTGIDAGRLEVKGYGSSRPLSGHAATDGANRRVMAVMLN